MHRQRMAEYRGDCPVLKTHNCPVIRFISLDAVRDV
jgi:hypothetical protein